MQLSAEGGFVGRLSASDWTRPHYLFITLHLSAGPKDRHAGYRKRHSWCHANGWHWISVVPWMKILLCLLDVSSGSGIRWKVPLIRKEIKISNVQIAMKLMTAAELHGGWTHPTDPKRYQRRTLTDCCDLLTSPLLPPFQTKCPHVAYFNRQKCKLIPCFKANPCLFKSWTWAQVESVMAAVELDLLWMFIVWGAVHRHYFTCQLLNVLR